MSVPTMTPFPYADLFTHFWGVTDLSPEGGLYVVECRFCDASAEVRGKPSALPEMKHDEGCPVAAYVANPAGGIEGRTRVHDLIRANESMTGGVQ